MTPTTDIDDAVRRWLGRILETHSQTEVSRWMGYGGSSGANPSRSQVKGYLECKPDRHFKIAYIAAIAAGLGITSSEAWIQIYDELLAARQKSPLPGREDRQIARERARRAAIPRDLRSKSAK